MKIPRLLIRLGIYFTSPKCTAGAMSVWVDQEEVLLVQSRTGEALWGFPGGILKRYEHPVDGALRELREETGFSGVALDDLALVGTHAQQDQRHIESVFRMTCVRPTPSASTAPRRRFEIVQVHWFPVSDLPDLRREAKFVLERYPTILHT